MDSISTDGSFDRPRELGHLVSRLIRQRGLAEQSAGNRLDQLWKQAVGPDFAGCSSARRINRCVLEVVVSNSAALEQIRSYLHQQVLAEMQRLLPDSGLKDIRYVRRRRS